MPKAKAKETLEKSNESHTTPAPAESQELKKVTETPAPATLDQTAPALETVASTMSAPNPEIENLKSPAPESDASAAPERVFNPEIHETSADGKPVLTPTGRYKMKKGARARLIVPASDQSEEKAAAMKAAQRRMAASAVVDSFINTGVMIFGEEWLPETQIILDPATQKELGKIEEREMLITSCDQYMAAKGINDIPPGLCLTLVVSSYCLKRVQKPKTQARLAQIFGGLKGKIAAAFSKIGGLFKRKK